MLCVYGMLVLRFGVMRTVIDAVEDCGCCG